MNECETNLGPYRATKLWNDVVRNFRTQMPRKRHRKHVRHFDDCFTSSEAIDWLHLYMQQNPNFNRDITRQQTLQLLRKFLENGLFEDIRGTKCTEPDEFKDNGELYRFNKKSPMKLTRTPRMPLLKKNIENNYEEEIEDVRNNFPKCHLIPRQISVDDLENTWKDVVLNKLQEKMELPNLNALFDTSNINAKFIIHNSTKFNKNGVVLALDKTQDLPHWIISAMKCLANWPNASGTGSCLPNYPGFQMDVFAVVKDYFRNLHTPLLTYDIFINAFARSEYLHAGKCVSTPSLETSTLSSEQIMNIALPSSLCFETAFTAAEPTTRIIPQQPFYLHPIKTIENSSVRRLKGKNCGYDNLAYLIPNAEFPKEEIKIVKEDSSISSYHTVPSKINEVKRNSQTSSSLSYCTPCGTAIDHKCCSWPSKRQAIEEWVKSLYWPDLTDNCKQLITDIFQLLMLLLIPDTRRKLHLLLRFINLVLKNDEIKFINRNQMLETFSYCILKSDVDCDELMVSRIINFLIDNYEVIFTVPNELHLEVQRRLIHLSRDKIDYSDDATSITYCEQVSKQQYENQKENHSKIALKDLFDKIIQDTKLTRKEKMKKLKKFRESYPDIYEEKMTNGEKVEMKKEKSSKLNLFQRVKNLRI